MIATGRIVTAGGAGALLAVALGLAVHGAGVDGWSAATRWTARWSLVPFVLTFAASGLLPRARGALRELLRNRRALGLAFALAHGIHAIAIVMLFVRLGEWPPAVSLAGGGLAYAVLLAMALTSTAAAQRAMGRWWKRLHRVGIWYIFLIFAQSYAGRLVEFDEHGPEGLYGVTLLLLALALRFAPRPRRQPAYLTAQP
jgi:methionine sulfoxide reductase heme-binding subunit